MISPAVDTLSAIGERVSLAALVVGSDGGVIAQVAVAWSSQAPQVAAVGSSSGQVTAVGPGTAAIIATAGPATGQATIVVLAAEGSGP